MEILIAFVVAIALIALTIYTIYVRVEEEYWWFSPPPHIVAHRKAVDAIIRSIRANPHQWASRDGDTCNSARSVNVRTRYSNATIEVDGQRFEVGEIQNARLKAAINLHEKSGAVDPAVRVEQVLKEDR